MEHFRGIGVGIAMGEAFKILVPAIGYKASVFNLVYETNIASVSIWRKLGFQEVGRIPQAGR
jgi:ribosomal protein S18 acetylase RimI-like enzyme